MAQYANFYDAWVAKNAPKPTPAQTTWTPGNLQNLANAYSSLNPTWTPPPDQNAALPSPIKPVSFDPYGDVSYAAGASAVTNANTHAGAERDYQYHQGAQNYGYDSSGNLITGGADLNPYAQAALLKRNYDNAVRGTTNSYASQGQLYSGALKNQQATNDFQYGASSDQLKRAAQAFYHGQDVNVQNTADAGIAQLAALLGPTFANFLAQQRGT
jgi:hypothetical protein